MKRFLAPLLALCLLAALAPAAYADVIDEPYDDFYQEHADECRYLGVRHIANGQAGYVSVVMSPEDDYQIRKITNGEGFYIDYVYTDPDGVEWGATEFDYRSTGWMRMGDLVPQYDGEAFFAEHKAELSRYEGGFSDLRDGDAVVVWTYPGSGEIDYYLEYDAEDWAESGRFYAYIDPEGREWATDDGSMWICASDPFNEAIAAFGSVGNELIPPSGGGLPSIFIVLLILVGISIVATVLVIALVYGRGRWKKSG